MTYTNTETIEAKDLLSGVWDNLYRESSPWVLKYSFDSEKNDGTEIVKVVYENEDSKQSVTLVTPEMLLEGFAAIRRRGYCWGTVDPNPAYLDAAQADSVLQYALFGKEVFA